MATEALSSIEIVYQAVRVAEKVYILCERITALRYT